MSFSALDLLQWLPDAGQVNFPDADRIQENFANIRLKSACLDSRQLDSAALFVAVQGENVHGAQFLRQAFDAGCPIAMVEGNGHDLSSFGRPILQVSDAKQALATLAREYLARFSPRVVGITGSNGKTTTKDFLRAVLGGQYRIGANPGNLNSLWGLPLAVLRQTGEEEILVLEMGASQPGEIAELAAICRPTIGCVSNVAPAHLEQFKSVEQVATTKAQLLEQLPPEGFAAVNGDDSFRDFLLQHCGADRHVLFGSQAGSGMRLEICEQREDGLFVQVNGVGQLLPIFGQANGLNIAAACAMGRELGIAVQQSLRAMTEVDLSPHRSRLHRSGERVLLDDCYNANPFSMKAALGSLAAFPCQGHRIAVLGDMAELGEDSASLHEDVLESAIGMGLRKFHLVGEKMNRAAAFLAERGVRPSSVQMVDLNGIEGAADRLAEHSEAGDVLLFKASRSVGLERYLVELQDRLSTRKGEA